MLIGFLSFVLSIFLLYPKTWEDPAHTHPETKAKGDNDPLDVCEIGEAVGYVGQVKQVKVLGVMALLDEGETDWKIMQVAVILKISRAVIRCSYLPHIYLDVCSVVDVNDPLAPKLNDIEDVERHLPGLIRFVQSIQTHQFCKPNLTPCLIQCNQRVVPDLQDP
jgi:inorganic pyrophosphatase